MTLHDLTFHSIRSHDIYTTWIFGTLHYMVTDMEHPRDISIGWSQSHGFPKGLAASSSAPWRQFLAATAAAM